MIVDALLTSEVAGDNNAVPTILHGVIMLRLGHILQDYAESNGVGEVTGAQTTYPVQGTPDMRSPDIAVIPAAQLPQDLDTDPVSAPLVAVEIMSRTDTYGGIVEKIRQYFSSGVQSVWIVWPAFKQIDVHTPTGHTPYTINDTLTDSVLPGLQIPLTAVFK